MYGLSTGTEISDLEWPWCSDRRRALSMQ